MRKFWWCVWLAVWFEMSTKTLCLLDLFNNIRKTNFFSLLHCNRDKENYKFGQIWYICSTFKSELSIMSKRQDTLGSRLYLTWMCIAKQATLIYTNIHSLQKGAQCDLITTSHKGVKVWYQKRIKTKFILILAKTLLPHPYKFCNVLFFNSLSQSKMLAFTRKGYLKRSLPWCLTGWNSKWSNETFIHVILNK